MCLSPARIPLEIPLPAAKERDTDTAKAPTQSPQMQDTLTQDLSYLNANQVTSVSSPWLTFPHSYILHPKIAASASVNKVMVGSTSLQLMTWLSDLFMSLPLQSQTKQPLHSTTPERKSVPAKNQHTFN